MTTSSPIAALIEQRCRELGLRRQDLVRRAGYVNLAKAYRRLDELLAGDLTSSQGLIERLPAALDVPVEVVAEAVAETEMPSSPTARMEAGDKVTAFPRMIWPCSGERWKTCSRMIAPLPDPR